jgi:hypothetical protein
MPELGTFGSVRGVPGNGYPYRNPLAGAAVGRIDLQRLQSVSRECSGARAVRRLSASASVEPHPTSSCNRCTSDFDGSPRAVVATVARER